MLLLLGQWVRRYSETFRFFVPVFQCRKSIRMSPSYEHIITFIWFTHYLLLKGVKWRIRNATLHFYLSMMSRGLLRNDLLCRWSVGSSPPTVWISHSGTSRFCAHLVRKSQICAHSLKFCWKWLPPQTYTQYPMPNYGQCFAKSQICAHTKKRSLICAHSVASGQCFTQFQICAHLVTYFKFVHGPPL